MFEPRSDLQAVERQRVEDLSELTLLLRDIDPDRFPVADLCRRYPGEPPADGSPDAFLHAVRPGYSPGTGDVVIAAHGVAEEPVARRYALVTRRRFLSCSLDELPSHPAFADLTSVTAFCSPALVDLTATLARLRRARAGADPLRIGILTSQSPTQWTEVAARQLMQQKAAVDGDGILFIGEHYWGDGSALASVAPAGRPDGAALVDRLERHPGSIFVTAHSRPHCGILPASDGDIGLCGSPTGGAAGRCVHGTACLFAERPRLDLRRLQCRRLFLNGCTTAALAAAREAFLPPAALVTHAAWDVCYFRFA